MKVHELIKELNGLCSMGLRDAEVEAMFFLSGGRVIPRVVHVAEPATDGSQRVVLLTLTERRAQLIEYHDEEEDGV